MIRRKVSASEMNGPVHLNDAGQDGLALEVPAKGNVIGAQVEFDVDRRASAVHRVHARRGHHAAADCPAMRA
jgi:hypothetical protein